MKLLHIYLGFALLTGAGLCAAEVYRSVDAEGNIIFSDTPTEGAEKIELKETTVVPSRPLPRRTERISPDDEDAAAAPFNGYQRLEITAPAEAETIRNQREVNVAVAISPALQADAGHRLQLYFDDATYGEPGTQTSFQLIELERGAHQLRAEILDDSGAVVEASESRTFFIHLHSIQHPNAVNRAR